MTVVDNIFHKFLNIKQNHSISDYQEEYERLSSYLPKLQDIVMENTFISKD